MSEIQGVTEGRKQSLAAHYDEVYRFVRRRSASDEDAEDVTQAVFTAAAARLAELSADSRPLLAWLYTVARRRLVDQHRKAARQSSIAVLEGGVERETQEYGEDVRAALIHALQDLPDGQREVVVLRLVEGRGFAEIAARIQITETGARMRFSRGIASVRATLEKEGYGP